jgi:hypothetical protein
MLIAGTLLLATTAAHAGDFAPIMPQHCDHLRKVVLTIQRSGKVSRKTAVKILAAIAIASGGTEEMVEQAKRTCPP